MCSVSQSLSFFFLDNIVIVLSHGGSGDLYRRTLEPSNPLLDLNSPRGAGVCDVNDVVEVVAHGDKEVEEELAAAGLHLSLHGAAALKGFAAADDEGEVMGAQAAIRVRGVGVGVLGRAQDCGDVDAGLEPLLAQGQALELIEAVAVGGAVDDGIAEDGGAYAGEEDGGVGRAGGCGAASPRGVGGVGGGVRREVLGGVILELPRVAVPAVDEAWVVVTLVEILEDGGENLWLLVGESDSPALGVEEAAAADAIEKGRLAEDVFVGCKEAAVGANSEGDDGRRGRGGVGDGGGDGRGPGGGGLVRLVVERSLQLRQLGLVPERALLAGGTRRLFDADGVLRAKRALEHVGLAGGG
jgi:hypothetical protein